MAVTSRAVGCSRLSNRGSDWGGHPPLWRCRAWIGGMSRRRPLEPELGWNRTTPQASLSRGHRDRPTDFAALGVRWSRSRRRVFLLAVLLACREAASRCMVSSRELLTTGCDVSFDRPAHRVRSPETVPWLISLHLTPPDLRGGSLDPPRSTAPPSRPFRTMTPDLIQSPDRGWMSLFMTTPCSRHSPSVSDKRRHMKQRTLPVPTACGRCHRHTVRLAGSGFNETWLSDGPSPFLTGSRRPTLILAAQLTHKDSGCPLTKC